MVPLTCTEWTLSEYRVNIQGTFREHSGGPCAPPMSEQKWQIRTDGPKGVSCSPKVPWMFSQPSLDIPSIFPQWSTNVLQRCVMFPECSLKLPCMRTECSLKGPLQISPSIWQLTLYHYRWRCQYRHHLIVMSIVVISVTAQQYAPFLTIISVAWCSLWKHIRWAPSTLMWIVIWGATIYKMAWNTKHKDNQLYWYGSEGGVLRLSRGSAGRLG
jgi:hypothetical protein